MKRVTGIGGIFFKSENPEKLYQWYEKHLGIQRTPDGLGATFEWRDAEDAQKTGMAVWSIFPHPAQAAGVTDKLWEVADLVALWESYERTA